MKPLYRVVYKFDGDFQNSPEPDYCESLQDAIWVMSENYWTNKNVLNDGGEILQEGQFNDRLGYFYTNGQFDDEYWIEIRTDSKNHYKPFKLNA